MEKADLNPQDQGNAWQKAVEPFLKPKLSRSLWQIVNTLGPYIILWILMFFTLKISYGLTLLLAVVAAGFLLRTFIIFHDCTHGAFFVSTKANHLLGRILGVLLFTPYRYWQHEHATHHATAGNLDQRGSGDIWTMTVEEYKNSPFFTKMKYRIFRNPFVLFLIGPPFLFFVRQRFVLGKKGRRERRSIYLTNIAIFVFMFILCLIMGARNYFLIQIPVMVIASCMGVWLFYVQHQFEGVYWDNADRWDYVAEALEGSSFYKLPRLLQWFTGSIGYHHVHHLSPRIPNYYLESCHKAVDMFQSIIPVTFTMSLKSLKFKLWDEQARRLVDFRFLKNCRKKESFA